MIDFIARINNITYNVKLAKLIGVYSSIFINVILDMHISKPSDEYVMISRKDIYELCAIDNDKQEEIENNLKYYNLLEMSPVKNSSLKNYYKLNTSKVEELLSNKLEESEKELNKTYELFKDSIKKPKTMSKRAIIIDNLKKAITIKDEESNAYLCEWIDAVMQKTGYLSKVAVEEMCTQLSQHIGRKTTQLREICKLAAILAYKDAKWVIKKYDENISNNSLILNNLNQEEIDENINELQNYKGETF